MKHQRLLVIDCGETTCASSPGVFCAYVRAGRFGTRWHCNLYNQFLDGAPGREGGYSAALCAALISSAARTSTPRQTGARRVGAAMTEKLKPPVIEARGLGRIQDADGKLLEMADVIDALNASARRRDVQGKDELVGFQRCLK